MSGELNDEHRRILRAAADGRLARNEHGRYIIDGEPRPARREREQLMARGLLDLGWSPDRRARWLLVPVLTERGREVVDRVVG